MKFIQFLIIVILLSVSVNSYSQELIPANKETLDKIISDNKDKVILFNYWATWCKPCVDEFPALMEIQKNYKDKD